MAKIEEFKAIRMKLDSHIGERIKVRTNEGRKRVLVKEGILEKTYPSIFVVRLLDDDGRHVSWSYTDILTDTVKIEFVGELPQIASGTG